jgi:hypothetical protein
MAVRKNETFEPVTLKPIVACPSKTALSMNTPAVSWPSSPAADRHGIRPGHS